MQEQTVKGHGSGCRASELDLSELAFLDFAPAVERRARSPGFPGHGRTEAYEKIYESQAVGVSIDDFVDQVQRRFANATRPT